MELWKLIVALVHIAAGAMLLLRANTDPRAAIFYGAIFNVFGIAIGVYALSVGMLDSAACSFIGIVMVTLGILPLDADNPYGMDP